MRRRTGERVPPTPLLATRWSTPTDRSRRGCPTAALRPSSGSLAVRRSLPVPRRQEHNHSQLLVTRHDHAAGEDGVGKDSAPGRRRTPPPSPALPRPPTLQFRVASAHAWRHQPPSSGSLVKGFAARASTAHRRQRRKRLSSRSAALACADESVSRRVRFEPVSQHLGAGPGSWRRDARPLQQPRSGVRAVAVHRADRSRAVDASWQGNHSDP
jgi:hypothetical protein